MFRYKLFRLYVYHPLLIIFNLIRNPYGSFKLFFKVLFKEPYNLYGFKIHSPYKLNNSFFANVNTHYNSFIIEGYEGDEMKLISRYLESDDSVLELGGCLGVISCLINKKLNKPKNHVVFEISPINFEYLKKNKLANGCKFKCVNGLISLNNDVFFDESNNFLSGKKDNSNGKRVQNIINPNNLSIFNIQFNVLVMDIEGGEIDILNEINLAPFNKIIYENHLSHGFISKKEFDLIEEKLVNCGFLKKSSSGNVDYWRK